MGLSPDALYGAVYSDVRDMVLPRYEAVPHPGCTFRQYASTYLLHSIIRKWIPGDSSNADRIAEDAFTAANNRCKNWSFTPDCELDVLLLGETKKILDDFFHPLGEPLISSYFDLISHGRPGPGVNVGASGTSLYTKYFASPLTTTSEYLYEEYKRYAQWIPLLSEAECHRYERFGKPLITKGSRCSFVPKTNRISRMICIEPSLNMYIQLGLATHLEKRLGQFFGIDLKTQPSVNHRLAHSGSIDGSFATIDLSSASDSISLRLCEMLLPKWFFELLLHLRSHTTEINGRNVPLFMISTMGNGFTFPLQTIIFSAVLSACSSILGRGKRLVWSAFGDDLICEASIASQVVRFLGLLNFSVNPDKTFLEGPFRESCGADWFLGQPVRPVFIKKLDLPFDYLVAINQLNDWSAYTGIPLRNTLSLLMSCVDRKFLLPVPFDSAMDSGVRVPLALIKPRFNRNLSYVFRTWERKPTRLYIYEGRIHAPRRLGNVPFNPSGLYCSFLYGELVSFSIQVRHNLKMFRSRLRCCPYWDFIPTDSLVNGTKLSWQQWETAVLINLSKSWEKSQPRA